MGGETAGVADVLASHGRKAALFDNPSIGQVLRKGEVQFLTASGRCDCGTALAAEAWVPASLDYEGEAQRLRKRGWSEAKIERAMRDRKKADERPKREPIDSIPFWATLVREVAALKDVNGVGLLVRNYLGDIATEDFVASRREVSANAIEADLAGLHENELIFFRSR